MNEEKSNQLLSWFKSTKVLSKRVKKSAHQSIGSMMTMRQKVIKDRKSVKAVAYRVGQQPK